MMRGLLIWWLDALELQMFGHRIWSEYTAALVARQPLALQDDLAVLIEDARMVASPAARDAAERAAAEVQAVVVGFAQGNGRCA